MGKIRRGNYTFVTWIGDHDRHVHIHDNKGRLTKWDLDGNKLIKGRINKRLRKILAHLVEEGKL